MLHLYILLVPEVCLLMAVANEVTVLNNLSFEIPEGKFTAIVGPSGSGKSTVIHLLKRFYDPIEGSITLDGNDLKELNVQYLRSSMSLVSQEPTLFSTSVFQNICDGYITSFAD
jgi:ATP-binding cassette, subfamily B (MDR/TAP), member 1